MSENSQELGVLGQKISQKNSKKNYVKEIDEDEHVNPATGQIDSQSLQQGNNSMLNQMFPEIRMRSVTCLLILIFIISFIIMSVLASNLEFPEEYPHKNDLEDTTVTKEMGCTLYRAGGRFTKSLVEHFGYWRLVTSVFVHGDIVQLAIHIFALMLLGYQIESFQSSAKYFYSFLISGVLGNLLAQFIHHKDVYSGASQSIFAMMGVYAFYMKEHYQYMGEGRKVQKKNFLYILLSLLFIFIIDMRIEIFALPFSFVIGIFTGLVYEREYYKQTKYLVLLLIILGIYIGGLIYSIHQLPLQDGEITYPCYIWDSGKFDEPQKYYPEGYEGDEN